FDYTTARLLQSTNRTRAQQAASLAIRSVSRSTYRGMSITVLSLTERGNVSARLSERIATFYHSRAQTKLASLLVPSLLWLLVFFIGPLLVVLVYSFARRGVYGGILYDFGLWNYIQSFNQLYLSIY